jgi:hypothetical protein
MHYYGSALPQPRFRKCEKKTEVVTVCAFYRQVIIAETVILVIFVNKEEKQKG